MLDSCDDAGLLDPRNVHSDLVLDVCSRANGGNVIWRWILIIAIVLLMFWAAAMFSMGTYT